MASGIIVLTQKGRVALQTTTVTLRPLFRNILVQVDGIKSVADMHTMFKGLKGLEETIQGLLAENYIQVSLECKDLVINLAEQMLGSKSPILIKKINDIHAKFGSACWDHLDELDKTARLFYGEVIADKLRAEIGKIVGKTKNTK